MNDMSNAPQIWARKGEPVTCISEHVICHIAQDIMLGDPRAEQHFCDWVQPQPPKDKSVAEICCAECRGFWVRGVQGPGGSVAYQFHFKDGWR
jgi:hypothetical protein